MANVEHWKNSHSDQGKSWYIYWEIKQLIQNLFPGRSIVKLNEIVWGKLKGDLCFSGPGETMTTTTMVLMIMVSSARTNEDIYLPAVQPLLLRLITNGSNKKNLDSIYSFQVEYFTIIFRVNTRLR